MCAVVDDSRAVSVCVVFAGSAEVENEEVEYPAECHEADSDECVVAAFAVAAVS